MADFGYIESLLSGLETNTRRALRVALEHLTRDLKLGPPTDRTRARNLGGVFLDATTSGVANREFAVAHGLGSVPYLVLPILPVGEANAKVVNLTVVRAADSRYLYLSSPETDAVIRLYVEGA